MYIKLFITFLLAVFGTNANAQTEEKRDTVSFTVVFDKTQRDKGGYWLNGYMVDIPYEQAKKLHRKKIKITGKVDIVKGLDPKAKDVAQGMDGDTKHIFNPTIRIIR